MEIDDVLNIGDRELFVTSFKTQMSYLSTTGAINEFTTCPPWMGHWIQMTTSIPCPMLYSEHVLKGGCFSDWNENILSSTLKPFLFWMLWTVFLQLIFSHIYSITYLCLSIGYLLNISICFMTSFSLANICFVFEDCDYISISCFYFNLFMEECTISS